MSNYAVVDLGSNTFHLLIVSVSENKTITPLCRSRVFVGLSDGGVKHIKKQSFEKGLLALQRFSELINQFEITDIRVLGTAALRSADNRTDFIIDAEKILQSPVLVINGMEEASFIYQGIIQLPEAKKGNNLIVDIGGGSTEFIWIRNGNMLKSASYPLGIGVLANLFHHHEPISKSELKQMFNYVSSKIADFKNSLKNEPLDYIIGASGSFEILETLSGYISDYGKCNEISLETFTTVYHKIVEADLEERLKMKALPTERAKLSPVGLALMDILIKSFQPSGLLVSPFALKEGVLASMINEGNKIHKN